MIDAYRDLLAEHDAEVAAAAARFRSRLSQLLAGDQVIEQPGEVQPPPDSTQTSPASPVPAAAEGSPLPATLPQVTVPAATFRCFTAGCSRSFSTAHGLEVHVGRAHRSEPAERAVPRAEAAS